MILFLRVVIFVMTSLATIKHFFFTILVANSIIRIEIKANLVISVADDGQMKITSQLHSLNYSWSCSSTNQMKLITMYM